MMGGKGRKKRPRRVGDGLRLVLAFGREEVGEEAGDDDED